MRQQSFDLKTWGGKRAGAGRKRAPGHGRRAHAGREAISAYQPVHVTLRFGEFVWNLRSRRSRFGDSHRRRRRARKRSPSTRREVARRRLTICADSRPRRPRPARSVRCSTPAPEGSSGRPLALPRRPTSPGSLVHHGSTPRGRWRSVRMPPSRARRRACGGQRLHPRASVTKALGRPPFHRTVAGPTLPWPNPLAGVARRTRAYASVLQGRHVHRWPTT